MKSKYINPIQTIGDEYKASIIYTIGKLTLIKEEFKIEDKETIKYKLVFKDYRKFKK